MSKQPRRNFLKQLGTAGAAAALAAPTLSAQANHPESYSNCETAVVPLASWTFAVDPAGSGESQGWFKSAKDRPGAPSPVTVPHTWQVSAEHAEYTGVGWYWTEFDAPTQWAAGCVRIEFEAVFHTAKVWLNGQLLGEHPGRGYTAFTFDATRVLRLDGPNFLAVKVDNSFRADILPRNKSYDWPQDGGIIRPVNLLITPSVYVESVWIDAIPDLDSGRTPVEVRATLRNAGNTAQQVSVEYQVAEENSEVSLAPAQTAAEVRIEPATAREVSLAPSDLPLKLWHFDHPHLYKAVVQLAQSGKPLHSYSQTFGARKFEVRGAAFYLNGERVWLMGVERMAGSNPLYGMAEPAAWITHDHEDMKELNCVFTRVHWQMDKRVLDYCDRHGILFQEEVPAWGTATFDGMTNQPSPEIMQNGLEHLREMIARDANHPCIVVWGLCNEVNGHNPVSRAFIGRMAQEARRLDPHRLVTYAANSLQQSPGQDAGGLLDFIEWNEYYESWYPGTPASVRQNLQLIHQAFPDKPVVISEYGYCECTPDRLGGDARRAEILRAHTEACREFDFVAATIFFDYNDYRTQEGDKGVSALKQRVHGVVDLYGNRKASFEVLRREASPIESVNLVAGEGSLGATLATRKTLPAYPLDGYSLRWIVFGFDDLPMEQGSVPLPKLIPGRETAARIEFQEKHPTRVRVDVMRPTGFSAFTAWWRQ